MRPLVEERIRSGTSVAALYAQGAAVPSWWQKEGVQTCMQHNVCNKQSPMSERPPAGVLPFPNKLTGPGSLEATALTAAWRAALASSVGAAATAPEADLQQLLSTACPAHVTAARRRPIALARRGRDGPAALQEQHAREGQHA